MQITNRDFNQTYNHALVTSLLSKLQIKQLSELTEELLHSDYINGRDVVNEYNIGVDNFSRRNGFGFVKELGLGSSGVYIARFKYVTIFQGIEEEYGHVKYNNEKPFLN